MAWDPSAAYKRLEEMERKELIQNDKVRQFLASTKKARYKEFPWGDVTLRIVPSIDEELRDDLQKLHDFSKEVFGKEEATPEDYQAVYDGIYYVLAEFCLDDPFNIPQTWEAIDAEQRTAFSLLNEMVELANSAYAGIKPFR